MAKDQEEIIKTVSKGRGGKNNFLQTQEPEEPGTNARYLRHAIASLNLPPIDISDINQCEERANQYFSYCIDNDCRPNLVGLCNWLGISRDTLYSWRVGECRSSTHSYFFKKCQSIMEEITVSLLMDGKVNPAAGIFILKNHNGYKDTQDVVLTPNNPISDIPPEEIVEKYQELPD